MPHVYSGVKSKTLKGQNRKPTISLRMSTPRMSTPKYQLPKTQLPKMSTPKISTSQILNFLSSIISVTAKFFFFEDTFQLLDIWFALTESTISGL